MATAQSAIIETAPASTILRDVESAILVRPLTPEAREALAQRVSLAFTTAFSKLAESKDDIAALWVEFENLEIGSLISGCATKTDFCEKVLGRSIRAVQYLLNGRTEPKPPSPTNNVRVPVSPEPVVPEPFVDIKQPESVPLTEPDPVIHTYPQEDYEPAQQTKAASSRTHGMGLDRLRELAKTLNLDCSISHDGERFRIAVEFSTESEARKFLER